MLATSLNVRLAQLPPSAPAVFAVQHHVAAVSAVTTSDTGHLLSALVHTATTVQAERGTEIIAQGEDAEYCFEVTSGCVRTVRLLEDGRRQVGDFLFAGDVFGWETLGEHEYAVQAVTPVTLRRFRLQSIEELADSDRGFAQKLRRHSAEQFRAARSHQVLIGRMSAAERIANFLIEMHDRLHGAPWGRFEMPMCRADMADYLCLTMETVSRGFADLRRDGTIGVERARIAIKDHDALRHAGSDRLH